MSDRDPTTSRMSIRTLFVGVSSTTCAARAARARNQDTFMVARAHTTRPSGVCWNRTPGLSLTRTILRREAAGASTPVASVHDRFYYRKVVRPNHHINQGGDPLSSHRSPRDL